MEKSKISTAALIGIAIAIVLISGLVGAIAFPRETVKTVTVEKTVEVPVEIEVPVEVVKEVDNGKLADVISYLESKGICDEDEDCVANIEFEMSAVARAVSFVKSDGFDEFDDCDYRDDDFGDFKDREISINKVYGKLDEVVVDDIDYDDKEATIIVEVQIKGKDGSDVVKKNYLFTVFVDSKGCEIEDIEAA